METDHSPYTRTTDYLLIKMNEIKLTHQPIIISDYSYNVLRIYA